MGQILWFIPLPFKRDEKLSILRLLSLLEYISSSQIASIGVIFSKEFSSYFSTQKKKISRLSSKLNLLSLSILRVREKENGCLEQFFKAWPLNFSLKTVGKSDSNCRCYVIKSLGIRALTLLLRSTVSTVGYDPAVIPHIINRTEITLKCVCA